MLARRLTALDVFTATGVPAPAAADLVRVVDKVTVQEKLGDPARLTIYGLEGGVLLPEYAALTKRAILRATFEADGIEETTFWRVREAQTAYGEGQRWSATCEPLWLALGENVAAETLAATGFVDVGVTLGGRLDDVLARLLTPAYGCPDGLATFALGSVDPALGAKPVLVTLTNASTLDGIRQALTKAGGEAEFVAGPGAGGALAHYLLLVKQQVGSATYATRPARGTPSPASPVVNRTQITRRRDDDAYFSHVSAVASGDSPVTLATATWGVTNATYNAGTNRTTLTVTGEPVWEDGALVGLAARAPLAGADGSISALYPIVSTAKPGTITVSGEAQTLTSLVVREADGRDLVALPAASAPHGRKIRRETLNVSPWGNALAEAGASADFSAFASGLPVGWSKVGNPAVGAVTTEGHVRYGTSSVQVQASKDEGLVSLPILRADARQVSAWVGAYIVDTDGGRIRLEIVDEDGSVHPVGEKADSTSVTLQALSIGGAPVKGATFRLRVVADSPTATFILDAATATRSASAEAYAESMGPNALWKEAAKLLEAEGGDAKPDAFDGRLYDLSSIVDGYDEIRIGDAVEVAEDGPMGVTLAARVAELEETFTPSGDASVEKKIRLSTKRADLRRLVETGPPPDPVPVVEPVRRKAPSAQYAVGFRHTGSGEIVVLSWLGNEDVRSVAWTLAVGASVTTGTVSAQTGQIDLNASAPITPGTTIQVEVAAYSDADGTGEKEAAPYRLVTDVPTLEDPASFVGAGATLTVHGTAGEVEVIGPQTQALGASPTFTLGLDDNVRAAQTLGVLGAPYFKRVSADQIGVHAYRTDGTTPYAYVVAKGFIAYEGGTFTRVEGEVVTLSDNLLRLNSDATTPGAWGGVFVHRGGSETVGSPLGKGFVWNESAGRWGRVDISYDAQGGEAIEMGTFKPFPVADTTEQAALNAEMWGGYRRADYLNQPVRTGDSVAFQNVAATGNVSATENVEGRYVYGAEATGSPSFNEGERGAGWRAWQNAETGAWHLETDRGSFREALRATTFQKGTLQVVNAQTAFGNRVLLVEPCVVATTGTLLADEPALMPGDLVWAKDFDDAGGGISFFSAKVTITGAATEEEQEGTGRTAYRYAYSAQEGAGSTLRAGAVAWQVGSTTDPTRQGGVLIDGEIGVMDTYAGVNSWAAFRSPASLRTRTGYIGGVVRDGVTAQGHGFFGTNSYLTGYTRIGGATRYLVADGDTIAFHRWGGAMVGAINADTDGLTIAAQRLRIGSGTTFEGGYDPYRIAEAFDQYRRANAAVMREVFARIGEGFDRLDLVEAWKDLPTGAFAGLDVRTTATEASLAAFAGFTTTTTASLALLGLRATALESEATINATFRTDTTTAMAGLSARVDDTEAALDVFAGLTWTDPQGEVHTGTAGVAALVNQFGSRAVLQALADGRVAGITVNVPFDPDEDATILLDADAVIVPGTLTAGGWKAAPEMLRYPAIGADYTRLEASSTFKGLAVHRDGADVVKVGDFLTGTTPAPVDITSVITNPDLTSATGWTTGAGAGSTGSWTFSGSGALHAAPDAYPDPTYVQAWIEQTVSVGTARAGQTVRLSVAVGGSYPVYGAATIRLLDGSTVLGSRTALSGDYPATVTVDARVPASGYVTIRLSVSNAAGTGARQATFTDVTLSHYLPTMQVGRDGILAWYGPDDYVSINANARALSMPTLRASHAVSIGPSWSVEESIGGELVFKKNGVSKAQITNGGTFQTL